MNKSYYLDFKGKNMDLFYHANHLEFPYKIERTIEITGADTGSNYENQGYYPYFYAWEISLLFD